MIGLEIRYEMAILRGSFILFITLVIFSLLIGLVFWLLLSHERVAMRLHEAFRYFYLTTGYINLAIIPFFTMRLVVDDRQCGRWYWLQSRPLSLAALIWGKYLAVLIFYCLVLLILLPYPLWGVYQMGFWEPRWFLGIVAMLLSALAYLAIGVCASVLSANATVAALVCFFTLLTFYMLGWIANHLAHPLNEYVHFFSIYNHYEEIAQGRIAMRSPLYLISVAIFFLQLSIHYAGKRTQ